MTDLNAPIINFQDAVTRTYPPAVKEPCNDCPWRRASTAGWLGPDDALGWLAAVHSETAIACHQTIPDGGGWAENTKQCRGAAIFRYHVGKMPRNPSVTSGPKNPEKVFTTNAEFYAHHEGIDLSEVDPYDLAREMSLRMYS